MTESCGTVLPVHRLMLDDWTDVCQQHECGPMSQLSSVQPARGDYHDVRSQDLQLLCQREPMTGRRNELEPNNNIVDNRLQ